MIRVSRLNGKEFVLNCELIKFVEATPDTVITLSTGEKIMVRESVDEVVEATVRFRQKLNQASPEELKERLTIASGSREHSKG